MTERPGPSLHQDLCAHLDFSARVDVSRLVDSGRFAADVRIDCAECNLPFEFVGLPCGVNLAGAAVSVDNQEARLAIKPAYTETPQPGGAMGFNMRVVPDPQ